VNAYNVTLSAFRNRGFSQSFTLYDGNGDPLDVSSDELAFVVLGSPPESGSIPALANTTPSVAVNVVAFDLTDDETEKLTAGANYTWQFIRRRSGSGADSAVVVAGPFYVSDSPPFPGSNE
jgi:hypothetical protein